MSSHPWISYRTPGSCFTNQQRSSPQYLSICQSHLLCTKWHLWCRWYGYVTVFIKLKNGEPGMHGLRIGWVHLLFVIKASRTLEYPCVLVTDYNTVGDGPDKDTGMWQVKRAVNPWSHHPVYSLAHLNEICHAAHLIPVFKSKAQVPKNVLPDFTLDTHQGNFYVNKYVGHHAFEIVY